MIGLGTIINAAAIVAGGFVGHFTGKLLKEEQQKALNMACGIRVANMLPAVLLAVLAAYLPIF